MPLQSRVLFRNELVSVRHVACRAGNKEPGDVEFSESNTLVMPLRGIFLQHLSPGCRMLAEPNVAFFLPAGCGYRVSHPASLEDDCLSIDYPQSTFAEAVNSSSVIHTWLSPATMAHRNLLWHRLKHGWASTLEVEETCLQFLASRSRTESTRPGNQKRSRQQLEAIRVAMLQNPEINWSLASLAGSVESSPFHLTRMFHKQLGVPLHRYLLSSRIARSLDLLLDTNLEITSIALDLGFSSHSHFSSAFRRMVGTTPSAFRVLASSSKANEWRKRLSIP